jgi:hypothetical protein
MRAAENARRTNGLVIAGSGWLLLLETLILCSLGIVDDDGGHFALVDEGVEVGDLLFEDDRERVQLLVELLAEHLEDVVGLRGWSVVAVDGAGESGDLVVDADGVVERVLGRLALGLDDGFLDLCEGLAD